MRTLGLVALRRPPGQSRSRSRRHIPGEARSLPRCFLRNHWSRPIYITGSRRPAELPMAERLKGKVAIVTGASKGIGAAIARMYASEGARVVVNYHSSEEEGKKVVEEIKRDGGKALLVRADVSKTPEVKRMVSKAVGKFGRVDILVNNAGILVAKDFLDSTDDDWDRVLDTNLKGAYLCCREVAPLMLTQKKGGKIINISSVSARTAFGPEIPRLRLVEDRDDRPHQGTCAEARPRGHRKCHLPWNDGDRHTCDDPSGDQGEDCGRDLPQAPRQDL